MAFVDPSSTDGDLLSSHSIFVSPLSAVDADVGIHPAADRYNNNEDDNEYQGEEVRVVSGDAHWRLVPPSVDPNFFGDAEFDDDQDDIDCQQDVRGQLTVHEAHPSRPRRQESSIDADNQNHIASNRPEQRILQRNDSDRIRDGTTLAERTSTQTRGCLDSLTPTFGQPPSAISIDSPFASQTFEDQPIRGLAGKKLSLDELIAQGERQMQDAQAKTASARVPDVRGVNPPPRRVPSPSSPSAVAIAASPTRQCSIPKSEDKDRPSSDPTQSESSGGTGATAAGIGSVPDHRSTTRVDEGLCSPVASGVGLDGVAVVCESTSARSISSVTRSASFATSWSGGDPDHLGQISMGVFSATGGDEEARLQEARAERERREFYELEMELLREEEQETDGRKNQHFVVDGSMDEAFDVVGKEQDDGLEDEGYIQPGGTMNVGLERSNLIDGRELDATKALPSGRSGWEGDYGHTRRAGVACYQGLPEETRDDVELSDGIVFLTKNERRPPADGTDQNRMLAAARDREVWQNPGLVEQEGKSHSIGGRDEATDEAETPGERGKVFASVGRGGGRAHPSGTRHKSEVELEHMREDQHFQTKAQQQSGVGYPDTVRGYSDSANPSIAGGKSSRLNSLTESNTPRPSDAMQSFPPRPPPHPRDRPYGEGGHDATLPVQRTMSEDAFDDDRTWGDVEPSEEILSPTSAEDYVRGAPSQIFVPNKRNDVSFKSGGRASASSAGVGSWPPGVDKHDESRSQSTAAPKAAVRATPSVRGGRGGQGNLRGAPSQSKLVQRVFGSRGRGGRGAGGRGRGRSNGSKNTVAGSTGGNEGAPQAKGNGEGTDNWAIQAELEGKLRELEDEIARYKEENERARLARRKQEAALAEIMRKRQEVREWAEAERAAVEAWCAEQRQIVTKEKRAVLKQTQALRARAQAGGGLTGSSATERRQRQEIEGLKATIERSKLDAEAARKKSRATERRLQQQVKVGAERVEELEGQVTFLERQRIGFLAGATVGHATGVSQRDTAGVRRGRVSGDGTGRGEATVRTGNRVRANLAGIAGNGAAKSRDKGIVRQAAGTPLKLAGERSGQAKQPTPQSYVGASVDAWHEDSVEAREWWNRNESETSGTVARRSQEQIQNYGQYGGADTSDGGYRNTLDESEMMQELESSGNIDSKPSKGRSTVHLYNDAEGSENVPVLAQEVVVEGSLSREEVSNQTRIPTNDSHRQEIRDTKQHGTGHAMTAPLGGHTRRGGSPDMQDDPRIAGITKTTDLGRDSSTYHAEVDRAWAGESVKYHRTVVNKDGRGGGTGGLYGDVDYDRSGDEGNNALSARRDEASGLLDPGEHPREDTWNDLGQMSGGLNCDRYDPMRYKTFATSSQGSSIGRGQSAEISDATSAQGRSKGSASGSSTTGDRQRSNGVGAGGDNAPHLSLRQHPTRGQQLSSSDRDSIAISRVRGRVGDTPVTSIGASSNPGNIAVGNNSSLDNAGDFPVNHETDELAIDDARHQQRKRWVGDVEPSVSMSDSQRGVYGTIQNVKGIRERDETDGDRRTGSQEKREGQVYDRGRPQATAHAGREQEHWNHGSSSRGSGGRVEHVLRDGRKITIFANGTQKEILPDGGSLIRFVNGDLKRVEAGTGVVVYTYAEARTTHTMHPSGLEVFEFPNGQVERHHKTGEKDIEFPDGTRKRILPSGREISEFPDGVTVVEYPEGHRDVMSPDGIAHREYSDGSMESLTTTSVKPNFSATTDA